MVPRMVGGIVAAMLLAIAAGAQGETAKPLGAYVSCGVKGKHADRFCFQGDNPVAVFRAFGRARVAYRVCFREEGRPQRCRDRRTGRPGQRSRTSIDLDGPGRYALAWFEDGRAVARERLVVRKRSALIVGDSLSQGTKPYLPRALSGWKLDQSVSISRQAPEGVSILRRRGGLPGAVIFALGTNGDPRAVSSFRAALTDALRVIGRTRCLVVPNIVRPPVGGRSYSGYNHVIAELAEDRRNVRLVNWARLVSRNRHWLADDGSHVNAAGYQARARAIARQVEKC